jgi:uncharacterized Zn finger protein
MAEHPCSHCGHPGRRLEYVSDHAWVDYYRCETCGQVWSCEKYPKIGPVRIVAAPEHPNRRKPSN